MFFDRLLKLQTLKFRLLGSTSFAQLYSAENLPLKKFRREGATLSPLIAGLLAACGGGGGGGVIPIGSGPTPQGGNNNDGAPSFSFYVLDGAIEGAAVKVLNEDGSVAWEGTTNTDGRVDIPGEHAGKKVEVELEGAFDLATGQKFEKGDEYEVTLPDSVAAQKTVVASPLTTVIDRLIKEDADIATEADAIDKLFGENSGITIEDLHTPANYIAPTTPVTGATTSSPAHKREEISKAAVIVQKLLEEIAEANSNEANSNSDPSDDKTLSNAIGTGGVELGDLDDSTDATGAIEAARARAAGKPIANPDITAGKETKTNYDEDSNVSIDIADWGFRDPHGNVENADNDSRDNGETEPYSVTITSITLTLADASTLTGADAGKFVLADGTEITTFPATLTFAQLKGLKFVPAENVFGEVTVTFTANDGDQGASGNNNVTKSADLVFTIDSVNDLPTDIEMTGDRDAAPEAVRYVLVNGEIKLQNGTVAGELTAMDVETDDDAITFSLSGADADLFEIYNAETNTANPPKWTLRLKADATAKNGGDAYDVTVVATDSDGGASTQNFKIIQAGVYVNTDDGVHAFSGHKDVNGQGILEETLDTATNANAVTIVTGSETKDGPPPLAGLRVYLDADNGFAVTISDDATTDLPAGSIVIATVNDTGDGLVGGDVTGITIDTTTNTHTLTVAADAKFDISTPTALTNWNTLGASELGTGIVADAFIIAEWNGAAWGLDVVATLPTDRIFVQLAQMNDDNTGFVPGSILQQGSPAVNVIVGGPSAINFDPLVFSPTTISFTPSAAITETKTQTTITDDVTVEGIKIGDLGVEGLDGNPTFTLTGKDADKFLIKDNALWYIGDDVNEIDFDNPDGRPSFDLKIAYTTDTVTTTVTTSGKGTAQSIFADYFGYAESDDHSATATLTGGLVISRLGDSGFEVIVEGGRLFVPATSDEESFIVTFNAVSPTPIDEVTYVVVRIDGPGDTTGEVELLDVAEYAQLSNPEPVDTNGNPLPSQIGTYFVLGKIEQRELPAKASVYIIGNASAGVVVNSIDADDTLNGVKIKIVKGTDAETTAVYFESARLITVTLKAGGDTYGNIATVINEVEGNPGVVATAGGLFFTDSLKQTDAVPEKALKNGDARDGGPYKHNPTIDGVRIFADYHGFTESDDLSDTATLTGGLVTSQAGNSGVEVTVEGGRLLVTDSSRNPVAITFDGVSATPIDEVTYVVVRIDGPSDTTGEVELLDVAEYAELSNPDNDHIGTYFVLGKIEQSELPKKASVYIIGNALAGVVVNSTTADDTLNGLKIEIVTSSDAETTASFSAIDYKITVTLKTGGDTYENIAKVINEVDGNPGVVATAGGLFFNDSLEQTTAVSEKALANGDARDDGPYTHNPNLDKETNAPDFEITTSPPKSVTTDYTVEVENIDDNGPIFSSAADPTASVAEDATATSAGVIHSFKAADADGDAITYTMSATDASNNSATGLFVIDPKTGELRMNPSTSFDFEDNAVYKIVVTATSTSTLKGGGTPKAVTQTLTLNISNVNEAPTGVVLNGTVVDTQVFPDGGVVVGQLQTTDPDGSTDTHSYSLSGADASLFAVRGNVLVYTGGENGVKDSYEIIVTTTDGGGLTHAETFALKSGAPSIEAPTLAENADASSDGEVPTGKALSGDYSGVAEHTANYFVYVLASDPATIRVTTQDPTDRDDVTALGKVKVNTDPPKTAKASRDSGKQLSKFEIDPTSKKISVKEEGGTFSYQPAHDIELTNTEAHVLDATIGHKLFFVVVGKGYEAEYYLSTAAAADVPTVGSTYEGGEVTRIVDLGTVDATGVAGSLDASVSSYDAATGKLTVEKLFVARPNWYVYAAHENGEWVLKTGVWPTESTTIRMNRINTDATDFATSNNLATKVAEDAGDTSTDADNVIIFTVATITPADKGRVRINRPEVTIVTETIDKAVEVGVIDLPLEVAGVEYTAKTADYKLVREEVTGDHDDDPNTPDTTKTVTKLYYTGTGSGDFETAKDVTVELTKSYNIGHLTHFATADAADLDDNADIAKWFNDIPADDAAVLLRFFDSSKPAVDGLRHLSADGQWNGNNSLTFSLVGGKMTVTNDGGSYKVSAEGGYIIFSINGKDGYFFSFDALAEDTITDNMIVVAMIDHPGDITGELSLMSRADFNDLVADASKKGTYFYLGETGMDAAAGTNSDDSYTVKEVDGLHHSEISVDDSGATRTIIFDDRGKLVITEMTHDYTGETITLPGYSGRYRDEGGHTVFFLETPDDKDATGNNRRVENVGDNELIVVKFDAPQYGLAHKLFGDHLLLKAKDEGAAGNDIKLVIVEGTGAAVAVDVTGKTITVTLTADPLQNTFRKVVDAINTDSDASLLVDAEVFNERSDTGKGSLPQVPTIADASDGSTNLANGYDDATRTFDDHLKISAEGQGAAGNSIMFEVVQGTAADTTATYDAATKKITVTMKTGGDTYANIKTAIDATAAPVKVEVVDDPDGNAPGGTDTMAVTAEAALFVAATAAELLVGDATNGLTLTAKTAGVAANDLELVLVDTGGSTAGDVTVTGNTITITFDAAASITLAAIKAAIEGHSGAAALLDTIPAVNGNDTTVEAAGTKTVTTDGTDSVGGGTDISSMTASQRVFVDSSGEVDTMTDAELATEKTANPESHYIVVGKTGEKDGAAPYLNSKESGPEHDPNIDESEIAVKLPSLTDAAAREPYEDQTTSFTFTLTNLDDTAPELGATVVGDLNGTDFTLTAAKPAVQAVTGVTAVDAVAATALLLDDNMQFTAKTAGEGGNAISITVVVGSAGDPLSVAVNGSAITVTLASTDGTVGTSTVGEIQAAIEAHTAANNLVSTGTLTQGVSNTVITAAIPAADLVGGVDAVAGVTAVAAADAVPETISGIDEGIDKDTVLFTVPATDPDGETDDDATNNGFTYTITGEDAALFRVDSDGRVRFVDEPNYEHDDATNSAFSFTVVATEDDSGEAVERDYIVELEDVAEAPTNAVFARATNFGDVVGGKTVVGKVTPDGDPETSGNDYSFVINDATDDDDTRDPNDFFEIDNEGNITFKPGITRVDIGEAYPAFTVTVTDNSVTDKSKASSKPSAVINITEGTVTVNGNYSRYTDGDGNGLLLENTDGSTNNVFVGVLDGASKLAADSATNDNDEFEVITETILGGGNNRSIASSGGGVTNFGNGKWLYVNVDASGVVQNLYAFRGLGDFQGQTPVTNGKFVLVGRINADGSGLEFNLVGQHLEFDATLSRNSKVVFKGNDVSGSLTLESYLIFKGTDSGNYEAAAEDNNDDNAKTVEFQTVDGAVDTTNEASYGATGILEGTASAALTVQIRQTIVDDVYDLSGFTAITGASDAYATTGEGSVATADRVVIASDGTLQVRDVGSIADTDIIIGYFKDVHTITLTTEDGTPIGQEATFSTGWTFPAVEIGKRAVEAVTFEATANTKEFVKFLKSPQDLRDGNDGGEFEVITASYTGDGSSGTYNGGKFLFLATRVSLPNNEVLISKATSEIPDDDSVNRNYKLVGKINADHTGFEFGIITGTPPTFGSGNRITWPAGTKITGHVLVHKADSTGSGTKTVNVLSQEVTQTTTTFNTEVADNYIVAKDAGNDGSYETIVFDGDSGTHQIGDVLNGGIVIGKMNSAGDDLEEAIPGLTINGITITLASGTEIRKNADDETENYEVELADKNEAPNLAVDTTGDATTGTGVHITESNGDTTADDAEVLLLTEAMLTVTDPDGNDNDENGAAKGAMSFTVIEKNNNGTYNAAKSWGLIVEKNDGDATNPNWVTATTFTLEELRDNKVRVKHDGSEKHDIVDGFKGPNAQAIQIVVKVTDTGGLETDNTIFTIPVGQIIEFNDAPVISTTTTALTGVTEGDGTSGNTVSSRGTDAPNPNGGIISARQLPITDADNTAAEIVYSFANVDDMPQNGSIYLRDETAQDDGNYTWTKMTASSTFTHQDVLDGKVFYEHDGSETTSDAFTLSVTDGNKTAVDSTGAAATVTVNVTGIEPVNDAPTITPTTGGTKVDWAGLADTDKPDIGDFNVDARNSDGTVNNDHGTTFTEGLNNVYTLRVTDMGVYDPDEVDAQGVFDPSGITFTVTVVASNNYVLERSDGTAIAVGETFTLKDVNENKIQVRDTAGDQPQLNANETVFKVTVEDSLGEEMVYPGGGSDLSIEINLRPVNDLPTEMTLDAARINPNYRDRDSNQLTETQNYRVGTLRAEDEETGQGFFTYKLVTSNSEFAADTENQGFTLNGNDHQYFEVTVNGTLRIKSLNNIPEGLILKALNEEYVIYIAVTDTASFAGATDPDQVAKTKFVKITLPVRDFDVDWSHETDYHPGVSTDRAPQNITYDFSDSANPPGELLVGQFRISAENYNSGDSVTIRLGVDGSEGRFVDLLNNRGTGNGFRIEETTHGSGDSEYISYKIFITPDVRNSDWLKSLDSDDTATRNFSLEVIYQPKDNSEADGFGRTVETFSVTFTGLDDVPHPAGPTIAFDSTTPVTGAWGFSDIDTTSTQTSLLAREASQSDTQVAFSPTALVFSSTGTSTAEVAGLYGTLTVNKDMTWSYIVHAEKVKAVPFAGAVDKFELKVQDEKGEISEVPYVIEVRIIGNNEAPTLTLSATNDEVTEHTDFGKRHNDIAITAAQTATGTWEAADVDNDAQLRLFVGSVDIGSTTANRTYEGRFGTLEFTTDGNWTYKLNARAEKIADGETARETFTISVVDEYGLSNANTDDTTINITITGTNDDPTALVEGSNDHTSAQTTVANEATVREAGYRTDSTANEDIDGVTVTTGAPDAEDVDPIVFSPTVSTAPADDGENNDVHIGATTTADDAKHTAVGRFDAVDVDLIDSNNQPFAADLHSFFLLGTANVGNQTATGTDRRTGEDTTSATNPRSKTGTDRTDADEAAKVKNTAGDSDFVVSQKGTYGTLEVNKYTGEWEYTLDNTDPDTIELDDRDTRYDHFRILVTDEEGGTTVEVVTITVKGTDDAPIITGMTDFGGGNTLNFTAKELGGTSNATDPGDRTAAGKITFSDDDRVPDGSINSDSGREPSVFAKWESASVDGSPITADRSTDATEVRANGNPNVQGNFGQLKIYSDGRWEYTLDDNAAHTQALNNGQKATDVFTIWLRDDIGQSPADELNSNIITLTIDITGANDAPTIVATTGSADYTVTQTEEGASSVTDRPAVSGGSLDFGDVDAGDTNASLNIRAKAAGSIELSQSPARTEAAARTAATEAVDSIAEIGTDNLTFTANVATITHAYGIFTLTRNDTTGVITWSFQADDSNDALQALGVGQKAFAVLGLYVNDDTLDSPVRQLIAEITGTNDLPTISYTGLKTATLTEDDVDVDTVGTGTFSFNDIDENDPNNTLTILTGHNSGAGTGANDAAKTTSLAVAAPATEHDGNTLTFTVVGTYGDFAFTRDNSTGTVTWVYTLDADRAATEGLNAGQEMFDIVTLRMREDSNDRSINTETISVKVTGTNDAPVVTIDTAPATPTLTEDTSVDTQGTGRWTISDVDDEDTLANLKVQAAATGSISYSTLTDPTVATPAFDEGTAIPSGDDDVEVTGKYGTFLISRDSNGVITWKYRVDTTASQRMTEADTVNDIAQIAVYDGDNEVATNTITLTATITGANDTPFLTGSSRQVTITEDAGPRHPGINTLRFGDVDRTDNTGNVKFFFGVGHGTTEAAAEAMVDSNTEVATRRPLSDTAILDTEYGTITLQPFARGTVTWGFDVNTNHADVNALDVGDSLYQVIGIRVEDDGGASSAIKYLVIQITGTNDAPTVTGGEGAHGAAQDSTSVFTVENFNFADVDGDDTQFARVKIIDTPDNGVLEYNDGGTWKTVIITGTASGTQYLLTDGFISLADITAGKLRYKPNTGYTGADEFDYQVDDEATGTTLSTTATMMIDIDDVNDKPTIIETGTAGTSIQRDDFSTLAGLISRLNDNYFTIDDPDGSDTLANLNIRATANRTEDFSTTADVTATALATSNDGQKLTVGSENIIQGKYGQFRVTIDATNGKVSWTYAIDPDMAKVLPVGTNTHETITISVWDDEGLKADNSITLTGEISGTNQTPSGADANASGSGSDVSIGTELSFTASEFSDSFTDIDRGDTFKGIKLISTTTGLEISGSAATANAIITDFSTLKFDATGRSVGEVSFTYKVIDNNNGESSDTYTYYINVIAQPLADEPTFAAGHAQSLSTYTAGETEASINENTNLNVGANPRQITTISNASSYDSITISEIVQHNADGTTTSLATTGDSAPFKMTRSSSVLSVSKTTDSYDHEAVSKFVITLTFAKSGNADRTVDFTVNIGDVDEAPVAVDSPNLAITSAADSTTNADLVADQFTDPEGDNITFTKRSGHADITVAASGAISIASGLAAGDYDVVIRGTAGSKTVDQTFTITVSNTPTAPSNLALDGDTDTAIIFSQDETHAPDDSNGYILGELTATGNPAPTFEIVGAANNFHIVNGNELYLNRTPAQLDQDSGSNPSSYTVTIKATNSQGDSSTIAVTLNIDEVDEAPEAVTSPDLTIDATVGGTTNARLVARQFTDPEDDGITFTKRSGHADITVAADGAITIASSLAAGNYDVVIRGTADGANGGTVDQTFTITVSNLPLADAPTFSSSGAAIAVDEDQATGSSNSIYTAVASSTEAANNARTVITLTNDDGGKFDITNNGRVYFISAPDHETDTTHSFTLTATTTADGHAPATETLTITVNVTDQNDEAPIFTSSATATVAENVAINDHANNKGSADVVYTAAATSDAGDSVTYRLRGPDATSFGINRNTGEVWFRQQPDHEGGTTTYNFTVQASVAADGNTEIASHSVTLTLTDVNDVAPEFGTPAQLTKTFDENIATSTQVVSATEARAVSDAGDSIVYSLIGTDAGAFTVNSSTGVVRFTASPDHETKSRYTFSLRATVTADGATLHNTRAVVVTINDLNDVPPVITSDASGNLQVGTIATSTVVYTAAATHDVTAPTWTLSGTNAGLFNINSNGEVTFKAETAVTDGATYTFNVIATSGSLTAVSKAVTVTVTSGPPPAVDASSLTAYTGGTGNDTLYADGSGSPSITLPNLGGKSGYLIQGGRGDDIIIASSNGDTIAGGLGADTITLGSGADTVIYRYSKDGDNTKGGDGLDNVANFERGTDKLIFIDASGSFFTDVSSLIASILASTYSMNIQMNDAFAITGFTLEAQLGGGPESLTSIETDKGGGIAVVYSTPVAIAEQATLFGGATYYSDDFKTFENGGLVKTENAIRVLIGQFEVASIADDVDNPLGFDII